MIKIQQMLMIAMFFFAGCATANDQLYYWGNYSQTLYRYTKEPSAKTLETHRHELVRIINYADQHQKRPPPGICAELGDIYFLLGNKDVAVSYFQKELELYPESEKIIHIALNKRQ